VEKLNIIKNPIPMTSNTPLMNNKNPTITLSTWPQPSEAKSVNSTSFMIENGEEIFRYLSDLLNFRKDSFLCWQ